MNIAHNFMIIINNSIDIQNSLEKNLKTQGAIYVQIEFTKKAVDRESPGGIGVRRRPLTRSQNYLKEAVRHRLI